MLAILFIAFTFIDYGEAKGQCDIPGANLLPVVITKGNCTWTMMMCFSCDLTGANPLTFTQRSPITKSPSNCTGAEPTEAEWDAEILKVYHQNCAIPPCGTEVQIVNARFYPCAKKKTLTLTPLTYVELLCETTICTFTYEVCMDYSQSPPQIVANQIGYQLHGPGPCDWELPAPIPEVNAETQCYIYPHGYCLPW